MSQVPGGTGAASTTGLALETSIGSTATSKGLGPAGVTVLPSTRWSTLRGTSSLVGTTTSSHTTTVPVLAMGGGGSVGGVSGGSVPSGLNWAARSAPDSECTTRPSAASRTSTVSSRTGSGVGLVTSSS